MANIDAQYIDADGLTPAYSAAAAGGDALQLVDNGFVIFKNTSAAAITVTLVTPGQSGGLDISDRTISVPATNGEVHVALNREQYRNPATGRADVTYSAAAGLTLAVLAR